MKIKCEFCQGMYDDVLQNCPSCGAKNNSVRVSTPDNPTTIEELKKWYEDRKLPPYETTRFFIGINYKGPRAFGIYKDENTGNFVVYKNKDVGGRAVRYEGTDEAFAVNELLMRLKQEIILQKRNVDIPVSNNVTPAATTPSRELFESKAFDNTVKEEVPQTNYSYRKDYKRKRNLFIGIVAVCLIVLIFGVMAISGDLSGPKKGYYVYNTKAYYYYPDGDWATYNRRIEDWIPASDIDYALRDKSNKYFKSKRWKKSYDFPAVDNDLHEECVHRRSSDTGYYEYNDSIYYHFDDHTVWAKYDKKRWVKATLIPDELMVESRAQNYFISEEWDKSYKFPVVDESIYYKVYYDDGNVDQGYYKYASKSNSNSNDSDSSLFDDDYDYYYRYNRYDNDSWFMYSSQNDDWEPVSFESVPKDLQEEYSAKDFYYNPTWDSSTQATDFYSSDWYSENILNPAPSSEYYDYSSDSDNDSSWSWSDSWDSDDTWDWGSSDSWDSGSTDWGSDW